VVTIGNDCPGSEAPCEIRVDRSRRGGWEVLLPEGEIYVVCGTLADARRQARFVARRRHPCEIVIRDAYHRVIDHQTVA
jgi:hypothetical protein